MLKDGLINKLDTTRVFFYNTIDCLEEEDSRFEPKEGMFNIAQHIAHTAQTIDWFLDGMFSSKGFDMEFEEHEKAVREYNSIAKAREWLEKAFDDAKNKISNSDDEILLERLPDGPIMGGTPRYICVGAIADHCAHHRGALSVYIRLVGKVPDMPYGDAPE